MNARLELYGFLRREKCARGVVEYYNRSPFGHHSHRKLHLVTLAVLSDVTLAVLSDVAAFVRPVAADCVWPSSFNITKSMSPSSFLFFFSSSAVIFGVSLSPPLPSYLCILWLHTPKSATFLSYICATVPAVFLEEVLCHRPPHSSGYLPSPVATTCAAAHLVHFL